MRLKAPLLSFKSLILAVFMTAFMALTPVHQAEAKYAAIVFEADSGKVLYENDQHSPRFPASLTKVMTSYLIFEQLKSGKLRMDSKWRVSKRASRQPPSKLGLMAGESITVKDALYALITRSANDIAVVAAENIAGSEARFAQDMTKKARDLGMTRTTFRNASGLPIRGQVSTARDLGVLGQAVIRDFPEYYKMFSIEQYVFRGQTITNHNHLIGNYPGADGIKTGYIRASGFNLIASAQRGGKRLVGVVLGGKSPRWRDRQMQALLDSGFEEIGVKKQYASYPVPSALSRMAQVPDVDEDGMRNTNKGDTEEEGDSPAQVVASASTPMMDPPVQITSNSAADKQEWSIQVGAYSSEGKAREAAKQAMAIREELKTSNVSINEVARGRKRLYRARLDGLPRDTAVSACQALKEQDWECHLIPTANQSS